MIYAIYFGDHIVMPYILLFLSFLLACVAPYGGMDGYFAENFFNFN